MPRAMKKQSKPDFVAVAKTAGEEAAENMSLDGEDTNPDADVLGEWAEDWYANHGVPSLQKAGDDADARVDVDDAKLKSAFAKSFTAVMKKRFSEKPKKSKKGGRSSMEDLLAENGAASGEDCDETTDEAITNQAIQDFEDSGILDVACSRAGKLAPAEGSVEFLRLRTVYVAAFIRAAKDAR